MDPLRGLNISVSGFDLAIIAFYLLAIIFAGVILTRLAARNINSYFLGGHEMPWWLLGVSGTASYFDVTGVMWTIAVFYAMGPRFFWIQWEWGLLATACFAAFMGKWLRRTRVMTGAEWMVVRFGNGTAGEFARFSYAIMAVVIAIAFVGFAEWGCGQFLHCFIPSLSPHTLAVCLMAFTAIYTVSSGLYGVVLTGAIQFVLILLGSGILIYYALTTTSHAAIVSQVPHDWFAFWPAWNLERMNQWEMTTPFYAFGLMSLVWIAKGVFLSLGGPQQLYDMQRFLAARNSREASKAGLVWGITLAPMFMVSAAVGVIGIVKWGADLPHPEQLYPVVIGTMLPTGIKGLVLAGLLSAFMSTFSATVNAGASYLIRDGYQSVVRPHASDRELKWANRAASLVIVLGGIAVGMQASHIDEIFSWIMIILGTGILMPNVLRWFWWRFNGWGFAIGTLAGIVAAMAFQYFSSLPLYWSFFILLMISTVTSVLATLLTPAPDKHTLVEFYLRVHPPGFWKPVRQMMETDQNFDQRNSFILDLGAAIIIGIGLQAWFLATVYICTQQWMAFGIAMIVALVCAVVSYWTWYLRLPEADEEEKRVLSPHEES